MTESAVRAEHLFKVFGRRPMDAVERLRAGARRDELDPGTTAAVIDASFEVRRGEIFVVMGLSGSGKSTLIRMLNGLLDATSGRVEIGGEVITGMPPRRLRDVRRSKVSMVFQHFALLPHRTVLDNVAYGLEIRGVARQERLERARETVRLVGLGGWESHLPGQLSGGMRQRVNIARAFCNDPAVLLMDEPMASLDEQTKMILQDDLIHLWEGTGRTVIFITHSLDEAVLLGDRVAVMSRRPGRIKAIVDVDLPRPRDVLELRNSAAFIERRREVWDLLRSEFLTLAEGTGR